MALPIRLKSALRPLGMAGRVLGPTGIGVLLSVGAHAGLVIASIQNSDGQLFDAFNQAAEAEAAEEKVVPIVQLTPQERDRLPAFAQPRPDPLSTASLGSLALPPGLRTPTAAIPKRTFPIPANRMPSATARPAVPQSSLIDLSQLFKDRKITAPPRVPAPTNVPSAQRRTPDITYIEPPASVPPVNANGTAGTNGSISGNGSPGQTDASGLPLLPSGSGTADILAGLNGFEGGQPVSPEPVPSGNGTGNGSQPSSGNSPQPGGVQIQVENAPNAPTQRVPTLALNPADGDITELQEDLAYNSILTSEAAVAEKAEVWSENVVAEKGILATGTAETQINAAFKACRSNPPLDAIIGVVVNPDRTLENLDVLQSTGYETLNLRAQESVKNHDFGDLSEPTVYKVNVVVNYDESGCVDLEGLKERLSNTAPQR